MASFLASTQSAVDLRKKGASSGGHGTSAATAKSDDRLTRRAGDQAAKVNDEIAWKE